MEIWKDIKGYEGKYQVNNSGNVKSLGRFVKANAPNQTTKFIKERILKSCICINGYKRVTLEGKKHHIHVLVGNAFHKKPSKNHIINHKNSKKLDNRETNIEWVTYSENLIHAYKNKTNTSCHFVKYEGVEYYSKTEMRRQLKISGRKQNKMIENGLIQVLK